MRKKSVMALDSRYVTMIENAYYYVSPPDTPSTKAKERPALHQFIRHLLYQELMKLGTENESSVLTLMRKYVIVLDKILQFLCLKFCRIYHVLCFE